MLDDYYRRVRAGEGRLAAMRKVRLALLANSQTAHPYFWAGLVVSGDPRTLDGRVVRPELARGPRGCSCAIGTRSPAPWQLGLLLLMLLLRRRPW